VRSLAHGLQTIFHQTSLSLDDETIAGVLTRAFELASSLLEPLNCFCRSPSRTKIADDVFAVVATAMQHRSNLHLFLKLRLSL
jgi:hypothetical protein